MTEFSKLDDQSRCIRKKYRSRDGRLAIHVPATSTPEQIQEATIQNQKIYDLVQKLQEQGYFKRCDPIIGSPEDQLEAWVGVLSKCDTLSITELMKEEISEMIEMQKDYANLLEKQMEAK